MIASLPVGFCFGTIQVVLPAFSDAEGSRELAGVLIAIWAASSAVAGPDLRRPPAARDLARDGPHPLRAAAAARLRGPAAGRRIAAGDVLLVPLAGAPIAPLVASRNELVERVALRGTVTEAFTWPLTALVAGVSLGAAVAGALTEAHSWSAGVLVATAVAAAGAPGRARAPGHPRGAGRRLTVALRP